MITWNFPNTTYRFAARDILDNFEMILLAVLLPNITTSHAMTYTNNIHEKITQFWLAEKWVQHV